MIRVLVATLVICSAAAFAQDDPKPAPAEKPIPEFKFLRAVTAWKNSVRLKGTEVQKAEQWEAVLKSFKEELGTAFIELDANVTNVSWKDDWITIEYRSRTPASVFKNAPLTYRRYCWIRGDQEFAKTFEKGDRFTLRLHLRFVHSSVFPSPVGLKLYHTSNWHWGGKTFRQKDGYWLSDEFSVQFGKEVYVYERKSE